MVVISFETLTCTTRIVKVDYPNLNGDVPLFAEWGECPALRLRLRLNLTLRPPFTHGSRPGLG